MVLATNWQFSYHHPKPLSDRVLVFNSFFLSSFIPLWTIFYERDRKSREGETLWAHSIVITWRRHLPLSTEMKKKMFQIISGYLCWYFLLCPNWLSWALMKKLQISNTYWDNFSLNTEPYQCSSWNLHTNFITTMCRCVIPNSSHNSSSRIQRTRKSVANGSHI